ncbi:jg20131 [Pararge aegeria aegeria]|uniref:Jg20131 protein n=1 Tax=Pararge aegeria aegeria TaxID=348720 RepID=A0A8S4S8G3_9NEOP|nr:jg20131 [Pararge aegeria aegeria]
MFSQPPTPTNLDGQRLENFETSLGPKSLNACKPKSNVRVPSDDLWFRNVVANYGPHKKAQSHSASNGESLGVSLRDQIRNEEIRRRTRVTDIAQRVANLEWKWAGHKVRRTAGLDWTGLVGPQRVGQTDESLGAARDKRPRIVDFGTPYKRPMSSSGLQSM